MVGIIMMGGAEGGDASHEIFIPYAAHASPLSLSLLPTLQPALPHLTSLEYAIHFIGSIILMRDLDVNSYKDNGFNIACTSTTGRTVGI